MEFRDRIGKILLVTLVFILAFVAYKRTYSPPAPTAVTTVEQKSDGKALVVKEDVEKIVRDFILNNPAVLIESIERMQQRKMEEMNSQVNDLIKTKKAELEGNKMSPAVGSGNLPIIMFYDISCTYCKKANAVVDQLLDSDKTIKVIYKPLPILGESSEYATKIEIAVYKLFPAKFKDVHTALISQKIASRDDIALVLDKNSISIAAVEAEFDSQDMKDYIRNSAMLAADLRIQGVPNFIIGDGLYPGFLDLGRMQAIIAEVKAKDPSTAQPANPAPSTTPGTTPPATSAPGTQDAPTSADPAQTPGGNSSAPTNSTPTPAPASDAPSVPVPDGPNIK